MFMGNACKLLNIENLTARVGDSLAKQSLRVGAESSRDFLFRGFLRYEGTLDTQFFQGDAEEIIGSSVNLVRGDEVVTSLTDIEEGIEICSLTTGGQYGSDTAFEGCNLGGNSVIGRVLQTCVEIAFFLQVEEVCHFFCVVILESCTLNDGKHARITILRLPSCLNA